VTIITSGLDVGGSAVTAGLVRCWLDQGRLNLALPGSGRTAERFRRLGELAGENLTAARIAEAHTDAVAILHELGGKPPERGQLWGVWAAESPEAALTAVVAPNGDFVLDGTKSWCSGADICTHALATAQLGGGHRGLFAVDLANANIRALPSTWWNAGMAGSDTRSVRFAHARAVLIGEPGQYLQRAGFWHGAIGVAACWFGGARAVAGPLYERAGGGSQDPHLLAHLGAVDAALAAAEAMLSAAADRIDADPFDHAHSAQLLARRTRAVVEHAVDEAITRTGRALGPVPLCSDQVHAQRVADLLIYVRQSHAERDLAELGKLCGQQGQFS
jgi:alkylation response protein AidB-like acyl-CoA dehydrogenase